MGQIDQHIFAEGHKSYFISL